MMRRRSNAGFFERLRGPRSTSYRGELQRRRTEARKREAERRHEERKEAQRQREAEREELRREREQIRSANKLKRRLLAEERREEQKRRKEEEREAPHKAMPSASAIERAYQRGAKTLSEAMEMARGNPGQFVVQYQGVGGSGLKWFDALKTDKRWKAEKRAKAIEREGRKVRVIENPRGTKGRFERCVKAVSERGGAYDPRAVCGAQEKKYRKNPRKSISGVQFSLGNDGVVIWSDNWDQLTRWAEKKQHGFRFRAGGPETYGHTDIVHNPGKRNPADAAIAVSEEFHGRKVKAMIPVQQKRHYHKYLAELGELRKLVVLCRDGKHRVTLSKFDGAILAANEDKNQLFIVGGDQSVNLNDFGIKNPHETETLGEVITIDYFTDKEHLGDEGGVAVYTHKFRSTNDNGKHKTVRMAEYPDLIYHLRDEHLEFSGGSYEIRAEGIDL